MGTCVSCPHKDNIADNHHSKFKVINVDDDGNELGSGVMELTRAELILHTRKRDAVNWPYLCLRRYGYDSNLFSFESGRRCQTGQGIFAFKCVRAEEIFNMLQEIMHNNCISVVEEPVLEPELPLIPHSPTSYDNAQSYMDTECLFIVPQQPISGGTFWKAKAEDLFSIRPRQQSPYHINHIPDHPPTTP